MGKSAPKPPPAPDPRVVSQAQTESNIATAREQQRLNMVNTYGPDGSVVYGADPNAPGGYSQTTTLSPQQQQIYNLGNQANVGALGIANDQIGRVGQALQTPLSMEGLPGLSGGPQGGPVQSSFNMGGPLQYGFDPGQQVQGQVGGDLEAARYQNMAAVYGQAASRLDPRFDRQQQQLETRLANQGLSQNSDAYRTAMDTFGRERSDAYNQAIFSAVGAGEGAANSMFGRQLQQGQFANQAAGQMYQQNMGQAAFNNQTAGQDYGQNLGAAQFANAAQQQQFQQQLAAAQMGNQARQQGLQEQAYLQNQPINQWSALMSGSQVSMPQGVQYSPTGVAPTDVLGAHALSQQAQQQAYAQQMQNRSGMMGGLFQLGSAAILASDERLKEGAVRVGVLDNGVPVYRYRYKGGVTPVIGVMAQDLAKVRPDLVHDIGGGFLGVNYGGL